MVHVDGSSQCKGVVIANNVRFSVGPDMRQVEYLEREVIGVSWEGKGDGEIAEQVDSLLPVNQLQAVGSGCTSAHRSQDRALGGRERR